MSGTYYHIQLYIGCRGVLWTILILLMLTVNCDPPDLYLSSSWDYRCEPLRLTIAFFLVQNILGKQNLTNITLLPSCFLWQTYWNSLNDATRHVYCFDGVSMPSVAFKIACMPPSNKYIYMTDSVRDEHSKNGMLVYFSVTVQLKGKKSCF
jgi:hypothetical protein